MGFKGLLRAGTWPGSAQQARSPLPSPGTGARLLRSRRDLHQPAPTSSAAVAARWLLNPQATLSSRAPADKSPGLQKGHGAGALQDGQPPLQGRERRQRPRVLHPQVSTEPTAKTPACSGCRETATNARLPHRAPRGRRGARRRAKRDQKAAQRCWGGRARMPPPRPRRRALLSPRTFPCQGTAPVQKQRSRERLQG